VYRLFQMCADAAHNNCTQNITKIIISCFQEILYTIIATRATTCLTAIRLV